MDPAIDYDAVVRERKSTAVRGKVNVRVTYNERYNDMPLYLREADLNTGELVSRQKAELSLDTFASWPLSTQLNYVKDNYKWLLTKESADINARLKRGRSNDDTLLPVNKVAKEDEGKKLTLLRASLETAKSGRCEQRKPPVMSSTTRSCASCDGILGPDETHNCYVCKKIIHGFGKSMLSNGLCKLTQHPEDDSKLLCKDCSPPVETPSVVLSAAVSTVAKVKPQIIPHKMTQSMTGSVFSNNKGTISIGTFSIANFFTKNPSKDNTATDEVLIDYRRILLPVV